MAKCALGPKKIRQCEVILGQPIEAAYTRGGWPVGWVECWTSRTDAWWVDRQHGDVIGQKIRAGKAVEPDP